VIAAFVLLTALAGADNVTGIIRFNSSGPADAV
jgi:hypothetical protein